MRNYMAENLILPNPIWEFYLDSDLNTLREFWKRKLREAEEELKDVQLEIDRREAEKTTPTSVG